MTLAVMLVCALSQSPQSPVVAATVQPQAQAYVAAVAPQYQAVAVPAVTRTRTYTMAPGPIRQCLARAANNLANPKTHTWTVTHTVAAQPIVAAPAVSHQVVMLTAQPQVQVQPAVQPVVYYQLVPVTAQPAAQPVVYATAQQQPQPAAQPRAQSEIGAVPPPPAVNPSTAAKP